MSIFELKCVILGDKGVGKQTLFKRLLVEEPNILVINDNFPKATFRISMDINPPMYYSQSITYQSIDNFYAIFIFIVDSTSVSTYQYLQNKYWDTLLPQIEKGLQYPTLLANKSDLAVNTAFEPECKSLGIQYFEVSLLPNSKTIDRVITTIKMKSKVYINKLAQGSKVPIWESIKYLPPVEPVEQYHSEITHITEVNSDSHPDATEKSESEESDVDESESGSEGRSASHNQSEQSGINDSEKSQSVMNESQKSQSVIEQSEKSQNEINQSEKSQRVMNKSQNAINENEKSQSVLNKSQKEINQNEQSQNGLNKSQNEINQSEKNQSVMNKSQNTINKSEKSQSVMNKSQNKINKNETSQSFINKSQIEVNQSQKSQSLMDQSEKSNSVMENSEKSDSVMSKQSIVQYSQMSKSSQKFQNNQRDNQDQSPLMKDKQESINFQQEMTKSPILVQSEQNSIISHPFKQAEIESEESQSPRSEEEEQQSQKYNKNDEMAKSSSDSSKYKQVPQIKNYYINQTTQGDEESDRNWEQNYFQQGTPTQIKSQAIRYVQGLTSQAGQKLTVQIEKQQSVMVSQKDFGMQTEKEQKPVLRDFYQKTPPKQYQQIHSKQKSDQVFKSIKQDIHQKC